MYSVLWGSGPCDIPKPLSPLNAVSEALRLELTNTVFTRASLSGRDRSNSKRIGIGSVVGALFTRATAKTNRGQYDRSNVGVR